MQAMQGQTVEERMHATGYVEGARKAVMNWYQPRGHAERDHLEKDVEDIAMLGDEKWTPWREKPWGNKKKERLLLVHRTLAYRASEYLTCIYTVVTSAGCLLSVKKIDRKGDLKKKESLSCIERWPIVHPNILYLYCSHFGRVPLRGLKK